MTPEGKPVAFLFFSSSKAGFSRLPQLPSGLWWCVCSLLDSVCPNCCGRFLESHLCTTCEKRTLDRTDPLLHNDDSLSGGHEPDPGRHRLFVSFGNSFFSDEIAGGLWIYVNSLWKWYSLRFVGLPLNKQVAHCWNDAMQRATWLRLKRRRRLARMTRKENKSMSMSKDKRTGPNCSGNWLIISCFDFVFRPFCLAFCSSQTYFSLVSYLCFCLPFRIYSCPLCLLFCRSFSHALPCRQFVSLVVAGHEHVKAHAANVSKCFQQKNKTW